MVRTKYPSSLTSVSNVGYIPAFLIKMVGQRSRSRDRNETWPYESHFWVATEISEVKSRLDSTVCHFWKLLYMFIIYYHSIIIYSKKMGWTFLNRLFGSTVPTGEAGIFELMTTYDKHAIGMASIASSRCYWKPSSSTRKTRKRHGMFWLRKSLRQRNHEGWMLRNL